MARTLERDAAALHQALEASGDEIHVAVSRETAELLARLVDAHARGERVLVTAPEVTPNEAASLMGMSRAQVRKLIDRGALDSRMVGSHHRVSVESIHAFLDAERDRRRSALADLAQLQDDLGLTE